MSRPSRFNCSLPVSYPLFPPPFSWLMAPISGSQWPRRISFTTRYSHFSLLSIAQKVFCHRVCDLDPAFPVSTPVFPHLHPFPDWWSSFVSCFSPIFHLWHSFKSSSDLGFHSSVDKRVVGNKTEKLTVQKVRPKETLRDALFGELHSWIHASNICVLGMNTCSV